MSTPQLPLGLAFPRDQRLDTYRGAAPGLMETLGGIASGAAPGAFLAGPDGSGRSHLLLAACAEAAAHGHSVVYLPLRSFGARAAAALADQGRVQLACVDDVQAIAGWREAEVALFDLHNRVRDGGGAVLYAANASPALLPLVLPDLRSRLAQSAQFALLAPDEPLRRDILRQRASARGLELDEAVVDYLFRHADRDLASLTALLDHLDRASLAAQRRITVPFLKDVMGAS